MRWDRLDRAEIIYKILLAGNVIPKNGQNYGMNDDGDLCVQMIQETIEKNGSKKSEEIWLACEFKMAGFYKWCQTFSDDEMAIIISNSILRDKGEEF